MKKILVLVLILITIIIINLSASKEKVYENIVDWPEDFYYVEIPAPENHTKVADITKETTSDGEHLTTVRIADVTWKEYREYCNKLESMKQWKSIDDIILPEKINEEQIYDFRGRYEGLSSIVVSYLGQVYAKDLESPEFVMYICE